MTIDPLLVPVPHRVVAVVDELDDVRTLHVTPRHGDPAPFLPAQCGMVGLPGLGEVPISISSDPDEHRFHAYTIRRVGPITRALLTLESGDELLVRGPFGNSWPVPGSGDVLVVGGGIGVAPLRSLIHRLASRCGASGAGGAGGDLAAAVACRAELVIGARTPDRLLYEREYAGWAAAGLGVHTIVDVGGPGWSGDVGVVTDLVEPLALDWPATTAFVCGPDTMMHHVAAQLLGLGVPAERVHLTLERNMKCGNALCGHCQLGPFVVCRDGPVASYATIGAAHRVEEL